MDFLVLNDLYGGGNAPNPIFLTDGALGCRDMEASDAEEEAENKERLHDSTGSRRFFGFGLLFRLWTRTLEFCFGLASPPYLWSMWSQICIAVSDVYLAFHPGAFVTAYMDELPLFVQLIVRTGFGWACNYSIIRHKVF